jgi:alkanesulfonate monooxygenase SsuD/methylene tetrahydromethanopterin reductase-like flavin-dependent oxidoreductase (luciferase family)
MKFGLFHSVQLPDPTREKKYYQEALDQVLWAEQLGYDSVWFTEHHFSRHGIVSASLTLLGYLAGITSTIRLGTAVTVLPFHNPIQIAEETATVDLLSHGRLDLGVGRGYQWGEYHKLNISMEEADRRFQEAIDVLVRGWTATEPFDHRGEFWTFNEMTVHPKPWQTPHPPLWVAASSHASMDRIAEKGWNLLVGQGETFQRVADQVNYFRSAVGEAGGDYDPGRVTVARAMYTAPKPEQVRSDAEVPFMWFKQTGNEVGAPPERRGELLPDNFAEYRRRFSAEARFDYEAMAENVILFGTPEQVAEKVELLRQSGVEKLILFVNYGGIESRKVMDSLELFAKEVMPQFPG